MRLPFYFSNWRRYQVAGINQWTIVGNVGRDATIRRSEDGATTFSFSLAVDGRGNEGEPLWVTVLAFGRLAEILARAGSVKRGVLAFVVGRVEVGRRLAAVGEGAAHREQRERSAQPPVRLCCVASQVRVLESGKDVERFGNHRYEREGYESRYVSGRRPYDSHLGRQ